MSSTIPTPDIDKNTARSLHRPTAMIATLKIKIHQEDALTWNTSVVPDPTHHLSQIRISTKKQQKAALQQGVQCFEIRPSKSELQEVLRRLQFFNIFTGKCAFRHSGAFATIRHRNVQCLSPQPRAFFQYKHVEKCSEDCSFFTFSLPNVLFATAACIFPT